MIIRRHLVGSAGIFLTVLSTALFSPMAVSAEGSDMAAQGKDLAFDRKKGNCLACHMMGDGAAPGNIAPPLVAMQSRYPDKAKLRSQIWDPTVANPDTTMPPFGKHQVVSEEELDKIVEYVWTL